MPCVLGTRLAAAERQVEETKEKLKAANRTIDVDLAISSTVSDEKAQLEAAYKFAEKKGVLRAYGAAVEKAEKKNRDAKDFIEALKKCLSGIEAGQ